MAYSVLKRDLVSTAQFWSWLKCRECAVKNTRCPPLLCFRWSRNCVQEQRCKALFRMRSLGIHTSALSLASMQEDDLSKRFVLACVICLSAVSFNTGVTPANAQAPVSFSKD